MKKRLENEIAHGKKLLAEGAESIWNWESPAGKKRANRRADFFIDLAKVKKGDKVLEIGCGTGLFTRKFYNATKADITAIDISEDLLEEARKLLPEADFKVDDAMHLSFKDNTFEVVFGSSVLHHLEFDASLNEIIRVLKPGGRMIFAEPNMINPQILIQKNIPFIKKWLGDSPDETAIVRWRFSKLLVSKGFKNVVIFPYDFLHPFVPEFLIRVVDNIGKMIEKIPLAKEIAGSVIIYAEK
ncbi:MAG: class I SAM-dependent methyltransferase [Bacteroidia bacterium]